MPGTTGTTGFGSTGFGTAGDSGDLGSDLQASRLPSGSRPFRLPTSRFPLSISYFSDLTVRATAVGLDAASTPIELVMSDRLRCCTTDDKAGDALAHMSHAQIGRLPVLHTEGVLVGMVSLGDFAVREPRGVQQALCHISTPAEPDRSAAQQLGWFRQGWMPRNVADPSARCAASGGTW